jgi:hypothetical protein
MLGSHNSSMLKIFVMVPKETTDRAIEAMATAGAGVIGNYTHNAVITEVLGNRKSEEGSNPTVDEIGKMSREPENKIEMVCPEARLGAVIAALAAELSRRFLPKEVRCWP